MKPCEGCGKPPAIVMDDGPAGSPKQDRWLVRCRNQDCPRPRNTAWHTTSTGAIWAWDAGEVGPP